MALQARIEQLEHAATDIQHALELVKSEENIEQVKKFLTSSREFFKCRADSLKRTMQYMHRPQSVIPPTIDKCRYCNTPAVDVSKDNHPICAKCLQLQKDGYTFCVDCNELVAGWCQKHHAHPPATFYAKCLALPKKQ